MIYIFQTYPLIWILMTRRTIDAYTSALNFVKKNIIDLDGAAGIIIDYENAMRIALKNVFPNIPVYGCLFHFTQALYRKMASMPELFKIVRSNQDAKFLFRKFLALAFLPADKVKDVFVLLLREALETYKFNEFAPFIEYFKNQWLIRVKPVHFSVFKLETRTTGSAEAFNGKINKTFRTHGAFFQFVEALQNEEAAKADQFSRDIDGVVQPDGRKLFYKKRSALISKYWSELEKSVVTPRHFVCVMANINNEILYDEKLIFTNDVDLKMSNDTLLMEGEDVAYVVPNFDDNNESEKAPQSKRRKRKLNEVTASDSAADNVSERSKRNTRKRKSTEIVEDISSERTKKRRTTTKPKRTKSNSSKKGIRNLPHDPSDDDSESDVNNDSKVYEIMECISRNGAAMLSLRKKIEEIEKTQNLHIDKQSNKCIICCERSKTTILLPCLHNHTCGPCWIMWKVHHINSVADAGKPKCPVCKKNVENFEDFFEITNILQ